MRTFDAIQLAVCLAGTLTIAGMEIFAGAQYRKVSSLPVSGSKNVIVSQKPAPAKLFEPVHTLPCAMSAARPNEVGPVARTGSVNLGAWRRGLTRECPEPAEPKVASYRSGTLRVPTSDARSNRAAPNSIVTPHFLRALAQLESGNNPRAIGRAGERTQYQISRAAWKDGAGLLRCRAPKPPIQYNDQAAPSIAKAYLQHLESRLATARTPINPATLYAAWNLGYEGFKRRGFSLARCPDRTRDAARRFNNLINDQ